MCNDSSLDKSGLRESSFSFVSRKNQPNDKSRSQVDLKHCWIQVPNFVVTMRFWWFILVSSCSGKYIPDIVVKILFIGFFKGKAESPAAEPQMNHWLIRAVLQATQAEAIMGFSSSSIVMRSADACIRVCSICVLVALLNQQSIQSLLVMGWHNFRHDLVMKGVMKEDKLWLTGAFICQVHFCNHFTRVFLHQKNQPENQRQGIWKSPWNQPETSCFGGIFQPAVNHNWFWEIPVPKKHMIETWGGWWILVGVPSFVFLQESCSNNCIERCYMHLLLAQVATKLWFLRSWFGTCFAPALGDVSNHPIEFGKISTGLKLKP